MKTCAKCKEAKQLSEFHRSRSAKDGHCSYCRQCEKARNKANHRRFYLIKTKARLERYRHTERGKASIKRTLRKHPKRNKARVCVQRAISAGVLPRADTQTCWYCPNPAKQYHHWHGYMKSCWLDVVPACMECHWKEEGEDSKCGENESRDTGLNSEALQNWFIHRFNQRKLPERDEV